LTQSNMTQNDYP